MMWKSLFLLFLLLPKLVVPISGSAIKESENEPSWNIIPEQVGMALVLLCWEALLIVGTVERDTLALPLWIGFGFLNELTAGVVWETDPVTWIFGVVRMPATKGREPFSWETVLVTELDELGMAPGQGKYKLG